MDMSLNIVNLIEHSPITKLSSTYNDKILNKMKNEGCFILMVRESPGSPVWKLLTPKLEFVKKVNQLTVSALECLYIREMELGPYGELGRIYVAHTKEDSHFILRSYEIGANFRKKEN